MTKFASLETSLKTFPPIRKSSLSKEVFKEAFKEGNWTVPSHPTSRRLGIVLQPEWNMDVSHVLCERVKIRHRGRSADWITHDSEISPVRPCNNQGGGSKPDRLIIPSTRLRRRQHDEWCSEPHRPDLEFLTKSLNKVSYYHTNLRWFSCTK